LRQLAATKDGGETWQNIVLPEELIKLAAISLRTPDEGYLLDINGTLFKTVDGAQNWTKLELNLDTSLRDEFRLESPTAVIRFTDADQGTIILSLADNEESAVVAMSTTDGGQTWQKETVPVEFGSLHLTHDGRILTVARYSSEDDDTGEITILQRQGQ